MMNKLSITVWRLSETLVQMKKEGKWNGENDLFSFQSGQARAGSGMGIFALLWRFRRKIGRTSLKNKNCHFMVIFFAKNWTKWIWLRCVNVYFTRNTNYYTSLLHAKNPEIQLFTRVHAILWSWYIYTPHHTPRDTPFLPKYSREYAKTPFFRVAI